MMMTLKYTQFQHSPPIGHRTRAGEGAAQHQRETVQGARERGQAGSGTGRQGGWLSRVLPPTNKRESGRETRRRDAYQTERKRSKLTSCKAGIIHTVRSYRVIPCRARPVRLIKAGTRYGITFRSSSSVCTLLMKTERSKRRVLPYRVINSCLDITSMMAPTRP